MKKNQYGIFFAIISFFLLGCSEKESIVEGVNNETGTIYGIITDYTTGNPVRNANVSLRPGGETTLTGYDGEYMFNELPVGSYSLSVSKAEYTDLVDDYVIKVKSNISMRRDLQIKKIPVDIRITDLDGTDISYLDFGEYESMTSQSFNIFNNGTISVNCALSYSCTWVRSVSDPPSTMAPGQTASINVVIDRSKLVQGLNTTMLYITTTNGNNVLELRAIGCENIPIVTTLPVTNPDGTDGPLMNTFHANVIKTGYPPYSKRGFCWSSTNTVPTISDYSIEVAGSGTGEYSYEWWDTPITNTSVTYYVRAWVKYGTDNTIVYGNTVSYKFNDF